MAAMSVYNAGLDALATWTTSTYKWMLVTSGAFDRDDNVVNDVLATSDEVTVVGYARATAGTKTRTVDDTGDQITYGAADPSFGTLAAGETVTAIVLYLEVNDDTDSVPVGWWAVDSVATDDYDPFMLSVTAGTVAYVDQA